jgi:Flp pilus assembly protein TadG
MVSALTLVVGISVDLTGRVTAKAHASDIAAQAARVAGQQLDADTVMAGGPDAEVDVAEARAAALAFVRAAGMEGTVTITGGNQIVVTTTATYRPVFLSVFGFGPLEVGGSASTRLVRTKDGTER